jgi:hypothetical protein
MNKCAHLNFKAQVAVNRLQVSETDPRIGGYSAEIRIQCAECALAFQFVGVPCGLLSNGPATSVDFCELRIPIVPCGETLPEMQRLGFLVKRTA